jgi:hypothetical protein
MSIDKVVLEKIRQKLKENNQSEELTIEIINLLNKKDTEVISIEEKIKIIENIIKKITV